MHNLTISSKDNDIILNREETKELIVDYRKKSLPYQLLTINETVVVQTYYQKLLGLQTISETQLGKKTAFSEAQQRMYFICLLKKAGLKR